MMYNGIINIYKEKGFTSHDVVAKLRGIAGQKKIGHTGTLDPDATGVLPVCLGKATKLCDMLTDKNKVYETVLLLGQSTDTQDISGKILDTQETTHLTTEAVKAAIFSFVGSYQQIPPMYSALKVNGKKLYELARAGQQVERKSREVQIFSISIQEINLPRIRMEVACSKGTYIRTLCHDIGEQLGCGGCMEELVRTKTGVFTIEKAITLPQLQIAKDAGKFKDYLIPIDTMFSSYSKIVIKEENLSRVHNGNEFRIDQVKLEDQPGKDEKFRVYDERGEFLAVYRWDEKQFKVEKMFWNPIKE